MKIYIDGKDIIKDQLTQWKRERVKKVFKILGYKSSEINNPDMMID